MTNEEAVTGFWAYEAWEEPGLTTYYRPMLMFGSEWDDERSLMTFVAKM